MGKTTIALFVAAYVGNGHRMRFSKGRSRERYVSPDALVQSGGDIDISPHTLFHTLFSNHASAKTDKNLWTSARTLLLAPSPSSLFMRLSSTLAPSPQDRLCSGRMSESSSTPDLGASREMQSNAGIFHRWVAEDEVSDKFTFEAPTRFQGARIPGAYPCTSQVRFSIPGRENSPKTLELLWSMSDSNPAFSAVQVKLPFDANVFSRQSRVVVKSFSESGNVMSNAEAAGIRAGDIIRAVSVPAAQHREKTGFFSGGFGDTFLRKAGPDAMNDMIVLEESSVANFERALNENLRADHASAVLIIERPIRAWNDFDVEEHVLKASSSYADLIGNDESDRKDAGFSRVYISKIPFNNVLDGVDEVLQNAGLGDIYPSLLEHTMVLVQYSGEKGCTAYDFISQGNYVQRLTLESLVPALNGQGFAGVLRKFKLRRIPRRSGTQLRGNVRASLGSADEIERAIEEFRNKYDDRMVLLRHDCRHYADALERFLIEG